MTKGTRKVKKYLVTYQYVGGSGRVFMKTTRKLTEKLVQKWEEDLKRSLHISWSLYISNIIKLEG